MVTRMMAKSCAIFIFIAGSLAGAGIDQPTQTPQAPTKAVELTGLAGVKNNTGGSLAIDKGTLRFTHSEKTSELAASDMHDVVTGDDSQRVVRGTLGTISMFGPYGSGRFLSLFRSKLDTLTIKYRDGGDGLHGVIFTLPVGTAEGIKEQLVAAGAHTSVPEQGNLAAATSKSADEAGAGPQPSGAAASSAILVGVSHGASEQTRRSEPDDRFSMALMRKRREPASLELAANNANPDNGTRGRHHAPPCRQVGAFVKPWRACEARNRLRSRGFGSGGGGLGQKEKRR